MMVRGPYFLHFFSISKLLISRDSINGFMIYDDLAQKTMLKINLIELVTIEHSVLKPQFRQKQIKL